MLGIVGYRRESELAVKKHMADEYQIPFEEIENIRIIVAYESEPDYSMSNWFLFIGEDGQLYENHGSHCSCDGFEGQWRPEKTSVEYLLSNKLYLCDVSDETKESIQEYIKKELQTYIPGPLPNRRDAIRATKNKNKIDTVP